MSISKFKKDFMNLPLNKTNAQLEEELIREVIEKRGITEVDIKRVDIKTRIVYLWNWRKIQL
jgi:hypothetical protein